MDFLIRVLFDPCLLPRSVASTSFREGDLAPSILLLSRSWKETVRRLNLCPLFILSLNWFGMLPVIKSLHWRPIHYGAPHKTKEFIE